MAKKIEAWEAEVDNGSATPTPPKKPTPPPPPPPKTKAKAKQKTYPIGQTEDDMSINMKKGGKTKACKRMARGGGIEKRGKTRGRMV
jgi:hypothetical protein